MIDVNVDCQECGHCQNYEAEEIQGEFQEDDTIDDEALPRVCSECGSDDLFMGFPGRRLFRSREDGYEDFHSDG